MFAIKAPYYRIYPDRQVQEKLNISQQLGFTLIEIMTAVVVGGILLAIALPNFTRMAQSNCLTVKANTFVNSLQFTRSEAIKRNSPVTLNASNSSDNANEWGSGWNIVDNAVSPPTLREVRPACEKTSIDETGTNSTSMTYRADGFIVAGGTFAICDDRTGEKGKLITISATGRPSIAGGHVCP